MHQIWPCRKIGQGQSRVIIWTNLIALEHPMLHTNVQSHWPFCSREEGFLRFLPYMGMVAILVMWPGPVKQTFVPLSQGGSIWNLASIGPVVSEEKMLENVDILHTYIHTFIQLIDARTMQVKGKNSSTASWTYTRLFVKTHLYLSTILGTRHLKTWNNTTKWMEMIPEFTVTKK